MQNNDPSPPTSAPAPEYTTKASILLVMAGIPIGLIIILALLKWLLGASPLGF